MDRRVLRCSAAAAVLALTPAGHAHGAGPIPPGDPTEGRALFVGARPFRNGGPPCGVCHGVAGQGAGVGASYGPDLSETHGALGTEAVMDLLASMPFPSMEPLYAAHPLVDAERAEVTAFLAAAGGRAPARESAWFAVQAGGVFAVLLGGIGLAARRRRGSARARLLAVGREGGR